MNKMRGLIGAVAAALLTLGILAGASAGAVAEQKKDRPADSDCCVRPLAEQKKDRPQVVVAEQKRDGVLGVAEQKKDQVA